MDISKPQEKNYNNLDSFVIFMCIEESVDVTARIHSETIILPAKTDNIVFNSNSAKLLEVYID